MPGHRNAWNGMPQSWPRGCVQANYQQLIPNLQFTIALCISCMNQVKKVLSQMFWLDLCTRWSVQERAQTSFCPRTLQPLFLWHENCAGR